MEGKSLIRTPPPILFKKIHTRSLSKIESNDKILVNKSTESGKNNIVLHETDNNDINKLCIKKLVLSAIIVLTCKVN